MKKFNLKHVKELFPFVLLSVYLVVLAISKIGFYKFSNIYSVSYSVSLLIPAVLGMQLLLVTGYFDLSTGSVAALSGVIVALTLKTTGSFTLSLIVGISIGIIAGLINSFLVIRLDISCLITTIATMGMWRGVALVASHGLVVAGLPDYFNFFARFKILGLELPIIIGIFLITILAFLCYYSLPLRRFYHVGSNIMSATICGLNTYRVRTAAFILSSVGASITGILGVSRTMAASPTVSQTLALDTIAACVIGGASLSGGRGSIIGAFVGLLIIQITENVVIISGISLYWRYFVVGIILICSVVLDNAIKKKNNNFYE